MKKRSFFKGTILALIIVCFTCNGYSKSLFEDSHREAEIMGELIEQGYSIEEAADLSTKMVYGEEYGFAGYNGSSGSNSYMYSYMDGKCNEETYLYRKRKEDRYL